MQITYISNSGVMIESENIKIIIDGLNNSKIPMYKEIPNEIKNKIINSFYPFGNINVLFYTHEHNDHFDLNSTIEFLSKNNNTCIVSNKRVISQLERVKNNNGKLIKISLTEPKEFSINDIYFKAYDLTHEGKDYVNIHNLAYLIQLHDKKILHVGDAMISEPKYMDLDLVEENIDLLLAPFPYVSTISGRKIIKQYINPKKIAIIHLPYKGKDRFGWIDATYKNYLKVKDEFIDTVFLENIGDNITI